MGKQTTYTGSVRDRIAKLFSESDAVGASDETFDFYQRLADTAGSEFELARLSAKRHDLRTCDFINFADALTHVGVFERRITPTFNGNGIANGCTFEFRRAVAREAQS